MKTPEDEAFDEIARKQGAWGGGFKAKQAMAADKVQDETDMLTIAYLDGYERGKKTVQRPWVGLTDEDIADCMEMSIQKTCRAVEQLLKERNHGT